MVQNDATLQVLCQSAKLEAFEEYLEEVFAGKLMCQVTPIEQMPRNPEAFSLAYDTQGLCLLAPGFSTPFRLSEARGVVRAAERSELVRACGVTRASALSVLDPFAGFGTDGLTLAHTGCRVTLVEQHPIVWALLHDMCWHALADRTHLTVQLGDGRNSLQKNAGFDVLYLDPMFPVRGKQALPNRGLQHLQALVDEPDLPIDVLLAQAQACAPRTVLKRRKKDPVVGQPTFQHVGRSIRFDVYVRG